MSKEDTKVGSTTSTRFCSECGGEIFEGQKYCSTCGKAVNEERLKNHKRILNKKHIYIVLGIIIFLVVAILVSFYTKQQKQQEARHNYLVSVKDFHEKTIQAGVNLEDIADTVQTYWKENIFDDKHGSSIDSAILSAMLSKSSEIQKAETYDEEILGLYRNLKTIPEGNEDLDEILEAVDNLYNSYTDFYSFTTDPSGNYTQYSSDNNEKTNDFSSKYRALSNIIKSSSELENIKSSSNEVNEKMNNVMKQFNSIPESLPKNLDTKDKKIDENLKKIIPDFYGKSKIDVSDIKKESEKFKDNESINNAIEIVLSTSEDYDNMIKYAQQYKKSNSQNDLDEFRSSIFSFRANVAMYILQVDSLEGNNESLNEKLNK